MTQQLTHQTSSPLLLSKSILARDSIFKRLDLHQFEISDERIKVSKLYQQLQSKIQTSKSKHAEELKDIDNEIQLLENRLKYERPIIHGFKLNLWELKNQIIYLEQMLQQENRANQWNQQEQYNQQEQMEAHSEMEQVQAQSNQSREAYHTLGSILDKWDQSNQSEWRS